MRVKRALISVSDKSGLDDFVRGLDGLGVEMISTGGTAQFIRSLGIKVSGISSVTGFPEMLDGRVKTLHPKIHGGLLAIRGNDGHMKQVREHSIGLIDMAVVNLYPFAQTAARRGVTFEEAVENIDIGGPSMLRSAAKNFEYVAVVSDPLYYPDILKELKKNGCSLKRNTLKRLAAAAFRKTAEYDRMIADYFGKSDSGTDELPGRFGLSAEKAADLRYGENPHQKAAFYRTEGASTPDISLARQLHGKELSFNNILDLDAAMSLVMEFKAPAAAVIKHTNPCGAATAGTLCRAYKDALACDPLSAFGSIIGVNRPLDKETAGAIMETGFVECVIAPDFDRDAAGILTKKKNIRLIAAGDMSKGSISSDVDVKKVSGGVLVQGMDTASTSEKDIKVVTKSKPSRAEIASLLFGWKVVKHVRSNAIVLCRGTKTVGIGAGQMSRVDSVIISIRKAGGLAAGSTLASDAFFPKEDAIEQAAAAGVKAIIQPGGSKADGDIIKAADASGLSMVFTGTRHFRH